MKKVLWRICPLCKDYIWPDRPGMDGFRKGDETAYIRHKDSVKLVHLECKLGLRR